MPSLVPRTPFRVLVISIASLAGASHGRAGGAPDSRVGGGSSAERRIAALRPAPAAVGAGPRLKEATHVGRSSELDLDVDAGRQVQPHERVDGLRRGIDDVDQALVRAHLEVLARVLVLVGRPDDAVHVLLRGQRDRPGNPRARTRHRVNDLPRRAVDDLVVIRLEPDADLLSRHVACPIFRLVLTTSPSVVRGGRWPPRRSCYFMIFVTRPAPTVRPPSRMAKRSPSSMAIGWISSTF